ncbi:MAG: potassium channel family protein [Cyanobacteriota bacterium]|nr:potassium channel family protein [Cyanobacteriota bacterium]
MRQDRFYRLLLWISLGVLACSAIPAPFTRLSWLGYPVLCALLMVGLGQRPPWARRRDRFLYLTSGAASIVALLIWVFRPRSLLLTGLPLLMLFMAFIGWSLVRLIHRLASDSPTEADLVAGGVGGYLLLGIHGGLLLTVIDSVVPGSFRDTATGALVNLPPIGSALEATSPWQTNVQRITYFAFVSLTTVGYGDIAPIHPLAQLASVGLSVVGPLYIAVVIGVVVSRSLSGRLGG